MAEAERHLIIAALAHPGNQRFTILSETCVFLYPPAVVWLESFRDFRSRINACTGPSHEEQRRVENFRCVQVRDSTGLQIRYNSTDKAELNDRVNDGELRRSQRGENDCALKPISVKTLAHLPFGNCATFNSHNILLGCDRHALEHRHVIFMT